MTINVLLPIAAAGVLGLAYAVYLIFWVLRQPQGNERMREIAGDPGGRRRPTSTGSTRSSPRSARSSSCSSWSTLGWQTAVLFLLGAVLSAAAGYVGMNISVRTNLRTAEAARGGLNRRCAWPSGAAPSPASWSSAFGLLGVVVAYGIFQNLDSSSASPSAPRLISVFARLGGGIYTKAADVGADLVGKVEAGIPEDDPRNPAVIADNVGDNVGDCAGMAADLFETYAVTAVAAMLLGGLLFKGTTGTASRSSCTR